LLPTSPLDDAVTVGYRTETGISEGDFHLSDVTRSWTHDGQRTDGHDGVGEGGGIAISNIPIRVPIHYLDRDDALMDIDQAQRRHHGRRRRHLVTNTPMPSPYGSICKR
jgi:hypothetical protein